MIRILSFLLLTLAPLSPAACTAADSGAEVACDTARTDSDSAYLTCAADGQADACAGDTRGTSYDTGPYDLCGDGNERLSACEAGYADGYDGGCPS